MPSTGASHSISFPCLIAWRHINPRELQGNRFPLPSWITMNYHEVNEGCRMHWPYLLCIFPKFCVCSWGSHLLLSLTWFFSHLIASCSVLLAHANTSLQCFSFFSKHQNKPCISWFPCPSFFFPDRVQPPGAIPALSYKGPLPTIPVTLLIMTTIFSGCLRSTIPTGL